MASKRPSSVFCDVKITTLVSGSLAIKPSNSSHPLASSNARSISTRSGFRVTAVLKASAPCPPAQQRYTLELWRVDCAVLRETHDPGPQSKLSYSPPRLTQALCLYIYRKTQPIDTCFTQPIAAPAARAQARPGQVSLAAGSDPQ